MLQFTEAYLQPFSLQPCKHLRKLTQLFRFHSLVHACSTNTPWKQAASMTCWPWTLLESPRTHIHHSLCLWDTVNTLCKLPQEANFFHIPLQAHTYSLYKTLKDRTKNSEMATAKSSLSPGWGLSEPRALCDTLVSMRLAPHLRPPGLY